MTKKILPFLIGLILIAGLWQFFEYKLLEVPPGITSDEAAFGYNGALLSKTYHDENGRLMPFFVLSLKGRDWRQPVTQYSAMIAFKIFGPSFFVLRSISVVMMLLSICLIFFLLYKIKGIRLAALGALFLTTTPILMIQSHMGLDNIAPVPFVLLWLLGVFSFSKERKLRYLVLSAVALGIGFYSYKAMRLIVPVWCILTVIYLKLTVLNKKQMLRSVFTYSFSILPFFAIIPYLEVHYSGAVFDKGGVMLDSYESFFYGLLANLDLSFLFISGDSTPFHSVGKYGALLLSALPFFLVGCYQAIRRRGFWLLVLVAYLLSPLLFGFANSVFRASRLLAITPPFAMLAALGADTIWDYLRSIKYKKAGIALLTIMFVLIAFNYGDFVNYYWTKYPTYYLTTQSFPTQSYPSYLTLSQEAKKRGLIPYIEDTIYTNDWVAAKFFEQSYFNKPLRLWNTERRLPAKMILLTNQSNVPGMQVLNIKFPAYKIFVPQ